MITNQSDLDAVLGEGASNTILGYNTILDRRDIPEPKKANHQAKIVKIEALLPHTNADSLSLVQIDGFQVVVRKGQFHPGDLGVYIQPDSIVPQPEAFKFIWEAYVGLDGTVPENRRRITVRKFRKEWSEGLLLPLTDFTELTDGATGAVDPFWNAPGLDISDIIGVTHYDPDVVENTQGAKASSANSPRRKFRYPRTLRGWFHLIKRIIAGRSLRETTKDVSFSIPVFDVEGFKNYPNTFEENEQVVVTEKVHGSNARFIAIDGEIFVGSRNQWKADNGSTVWHKVLKQNEDLTRWLLEHPGHAIYGEVTPTQKNFPYGPKDDAVEGEVRFFAFDILTPQREWMDYGSFSFSLLSYPGIEMAPLLYLGPYNKDKIMTLVDGPSWVYRANHIREGVVIKATKERTVRGLGRAMLKIVSNTFLEGDSK